MNLLFICFSLDFKSFASSHRDSGPVCVSHHLQSVSTSLRCVHHRSVEIATLQIPPGFPQRTACKTYQDLCICIQSLLRWTQRWKCRDAGPSQAASAACPANAYGFKVVICCRLHNAATVWLSHGGAKRRCRVGNPSLESVHLGNCDLVTWEKHKGAGVTEETLMLKHWMRLEVSLRWLLINW